MTKPCLVFIDGPNIERSFQEMYGRRLEHETLLRILREKVVIKNIIYFTVTVGDDAKLEKLEALGYKVREEKGIQLPDGTMKGDIDAFAGYSISVECRKYGPNEVDIVLLSGDGGFTRVIEGLSIGGYKTTVISFRHSTSRRLINQADDFVPLEDLFDNDAKREREIAKAETKEILVKEEKRETEKRGIGDWWHKINPLKGN